MAFKGEIKRTAIVSNGNGAKFHEDLWSHIEQMGNRYVEIHYQTVMHPTGEALFTALLIGRERGDTDS